MPTLSRIAARLSRNRHAAMARAGPSADKVYLYAQEQNIDRTYDNIGVGAGVKAQFRRRTARCRRQASMQAAHEKRTKTPTTFLSR